MTALLHWSGTRIYDGEALKSPLPSLPTWGVALVAPKDLARRWRSAEGDVLLARWAAEGGPPAMVEMCLGRRYFGWAKGVPFETGYVVGKGAQRLDDKLERRIEALPDLALAHVVAEALGATGDPDLFPVAEEILDEIAWRGDSDRGTFLNADGIAEAIPTRVGHALLSEELRKVPGLVWFKGGRYTEFHYALDGGRLKFFAFRDGSRSLDVSEASWSAGRRDRRKRLMTEVLETATPRGSAEETSAVDAALRVLDCVDDPEVVTLRALVRASLARR